MPLLIQNSAVLTGSLRGERREVRRGAMAWIRASYLWEEENPRTDLSRPLAPLLGSRGRMSDPALPRSGSWDPAVLIMLALLSAA